MDDNPERVIFRTENGGEATYMGTLTHAGIIQQGLPRGSSFRPGSGERGGSMKYQKLVVMLDVLWEQIVYRWAFLEGKEPRDVCNGTFGAQARGVFLFQKAETTGWWKCLLLRHLC